MIRIHRSHTRNRAGLNASGIAGILPERGLVERGEELTLLA